MKPCNKCGDYHALYEPCIMPLGVAMSSGKASEQKEQAETFAERERRYKREYADRNRDRLRAYQREYMRLKRSKDHTNQ